MLSFALVLWFASEFQMRQARDLGETQQQQGAHNQLTNWPTQTPCLTQHMIREIGTQKLSLDKHFWMAAGICLVPSYLSTTGWLGFAFFPKDMYNDFLMFTSVSCKVAVNLLGIPNQNNNCRIYPSSAGQCYFPNSFPELCLKSFLSCT